MCYTSTKKINYIKIIMNNIKLFMMSMFFILMLGCSSQAKKSSHLTVTTRITTGKLTTDLTDTLKSKKSHLDSLLFAGTLEYISQTSKVSCTDKRTIAKNIIYKALENNIDICFILAQGTIETNLGTNGIGRTKKSLFGIYKTYKSYEECIDDYVKLLKTKYLVGGKTHHHLMKKYVNKNGHRYAGNMKYERMLKEKYTEIRNNTSIYKLQQELKRNEKH